MVKNLNLFKSISNIFKTPVEIYKGPIRKVYADDFRLDDSGKPVYQRKDTIIKEDATFYKRAFDFVNIEFNCILANQEEAVDYCNSVMEKRNNVLKSLLNDSKVDAKEEHRLFNKLRQDSSCIYYKIDELNYSHTVSGDKFKEIVKKK